MLKSYPVGLSLTVLVSLVGVVEGSVIALAMEWNNPAAWSIHFDFQLLAILYAVNFIYFFLYSLSSLFILEMPMKSRSRTGMENPCLNGKWGGSK